MTGTLYQRRRATFNHFSTFLLAQEDRSFAKTGSGQKHIRKVHTLNQMAFAQGGKLLVAYEDGTSELLTESAVRRVLVAATVTNDDETEATAAAAVHVATAADGSAAAASAPEPDQPEIDKVCSICIDTMASLDASTEVVVFRCGHVFCELHVPLANNLYRLFSCLRHALSIT
jgi:hypothetical protein